MPTYRIDAVLEIEAETTEEAWVKAQTIVGTIKQVQYITEPEETN